MLTNDSLTSPTPLRRVLFCDTNANTKKLHLNGTSMLRLGTLDRHVSAGPQAEFRVGDCGPARTRHPRLVWAPMSHHGNISAYIAAPVWVFPSILSKAKILLKINACFCAPSSMHRAISFMKVVYGGITYFICDHLSLSQWNTSNVFRPRSRDGNVRLTDHHFGPGWNISGWQISQVDLMCLYGWILYLLD